MPASSPPSARSPRLPRKLRGWLLAAGLWLSVAGAVSTASPAAPAMRAAPASPSASLAKSSPAPSAVRNADNAAPRMPAVPPGAEGATGIRDYAYTPLLVNDGAPADIWTLEQGPNGVLWLGTGMGLFRFDGLRFDRYALRDGQRLPSSNINALKVMPDGTLWLGFHGGGAARLKDGRVRAYGAADGMPAGRVLHFAQTSDGVLWAAAGSGLARLVGDRWETVGPEAGFSDGAVDYVHVDRRGVLWICSSRRLFFLLPGEQRLHDTGIPVGRTALVAEDLEGRVWLSESIAGTRPLPDLTGAAAHASRPPAAVSALGAATVAAAASSPAAAPPAAGASGPRPLVLPPIPSSTPPAYATAKQLLFARDGSLWLTVAGSGVWRLPAAADIPTGHSLRPQDGLERFEREQGLTSPVVVPVVEDREGTVWVGSNNGLGSFQRTRLHEVQMLASTSVGGFALVAQGDGVLASNIRQTVVVDPPSPPRELAGPAPSRNAVLGSDGAVWWITPDRIFRRDAGGTSEWLLPVSARRTQVLAMLPDGGSGMWLSVEDDGLYLATPDGIQRDRRLRELPAPMTMTQGPDGALWMANEDQVLRWSDDHLTRWTSQDGLAIGRATAISITHRRLVVAGENGVAFFDGQRFTTLTQNADAAFGHVTGIVESLNGDLWLNGGRGVVQVQAEELRKLLKALGERQSRAASGQAGVAGGTPPGERPADAGGEEAAEPPAERLNYRLFDRRDGLPGIALQAGVVPTALRDRRGRLWFATNRGVAWLDPDSVPRNEQPPLTEIHGVRSGERQFLVDEGLTLPPGTTHLTLSYTAVTLAAADRARFRYRLEGVDRGWHDAGNVREATYANLSPGRYRFQVMAANGDGVWDTRGAALEFRIAPTFTQTRSFGIGVVLAVLLVAWLAYRMRTRAIARQVQWRMEERHRERERIARELHDTLLQGVQGLVLQFNSVARRVAQPELNDRLERVLSNAERLIMSARDRVSDLRTHDGPLSQDLSTAAAAHTDQRLQVDVHVEGTEPALRPAVRDELMMIGREAITNALRHAQATRLGVWLTYDERRMTLRIVDDGQGVPPGFVSPDGRPGHHGIKGMYERARRLHGSLRIRVREEGGTEVEVRVLASHAYLPAGSDRRHRLRRALRAWLLKPLRRLLGRFSRTGRRNL